MMNEWKLLEEKLSKRKKYREKDRIERERRWKKSAEKKLNIKTEKVAIFENA